MKRLIPLLAFGLLAGCDAHVERDTSSFSGAHGGFEVAPSDQALMSEGEQSEASSGNTAADFQQFMAYRFTYGYVLPAAAISATANSHMQICLDAGPAKCEVLNSSTQNHHDSHVSARLRIRAEPKWLETYKETINNSVEDAKGELQSSSIAAEDLTRAILDTDARLKAKKTLRDRLESHLETRDAGLSDLLALERELSRVQGEIESITSNLNVLKKRVSKSIVNINYQSKSVAVDGGTFSPVKDAFKDFFENFAWALGAVITFFAAFLPWLLLVILPLLWFVRWLWRRWRRDPKPKKVKS